MAREADSSERGGRGSIDPLGGVGADRAYRRRDSPHASWRVLLGLGRAEHRTQIFPPPTRFCLAYHVGNSCSICRRPGMVVVLAGPGSGGGQKQRICGREGFFVTRGLRGWADLGSREKRRGGCGFFGGSG